MLTRARRGRAATPAARGHDVYQLKVVLREVEPPVWRRLHVPGSLRLDRLHRVLQRVMGWTNSHLHEFVIAGRRYGEPDPEGGPTAVLPEHRVRLCDVAAAENRHFLYRYDFGDNWQHEVLVERISTAREGGVVPVCLAGARRCPPEDCGGVPGYEEFLATIHDVGHPQHDERLAWVGGAFDAESFDLDQVNRALAGPRRQKRGRRR